MNPGRDRPKYGNFIISPNSADSRPWTSESVACGDWKQVKSLPRIELRGNSIESFGVYGLELRGIDPPLICRYLQPIKYRR